MSSDKPESREPVVAALLVVTEVLEAEGSEYALIGGLAAAQHGVIRATQDVEFLIAVPPVRLPPLLDKLRQSGCDIDTTRVIREWGSDHLTQFRYRDIPIDWLKPVIPLFRSVLGRATHRDIRGHRIRVVDAEGVVLMKLVAFRPEDQRDVEAIVSASAQLDWAFVTSQLASTFNPDDKRFVWLRTAVVGCPKAPY